MKALRRDDRGAAAVEFALVLPVLVLIVFGIAQFGLAFAQVLSLNSGARQGARLGVVEGATCSGVVSETKKAAETVGIVASDADLTVPPPGACPGSPPCTGRRGQPLVVTISKPFDVNLPFFSPLSLTGKGEYRCETN